MEAKQGGREGETLKDAEGSWRRTRITAEEFSQEVKRERKQSA